MGGAEGDKCPYAIPPLYYLDKYNRLLLEKMLADLPVLVQLSVALHNSAFREHCTTVERRVKVMEDLDFKVSQICILEVLETQNFTLEIGFVIILNTHYSLLLSLLSYYY